MDTESYAKRWLITITVMLVAVLEVLDMTIVNVSLPHMMASLGADTDQVTWVLTSYVVAAAICMPLTGFLVRRFGQRRLLLINIIAFMFASILCGISQNLTQMVIFRTFQGIFGASLVPLSQFILRNVFPPQEQSKAMAIWGIGIMAGPVLGPTLGGYITETLNWRWVFYINIPACILAWLMTLKLIKETAAQKNYIDWPGMALMSIGIGCLQLFLDRGNTDDWFESATIIFFACTSFFCLCCFIIRGWHKPDNIINLKLFTNRNFACSTLMITLFSIAIFGTIALNPLMLETIMGYPTNTAGLAMAPRGIASACGMIVVAKLANKIDLRWLILTGIGMATTGTYLMSQYSAIISMQDFIIPACLQGFGMGLFFVPLSTFALSTIRQQHYAEAAGLFSFGRSIGVSIGISLMSTLLTRKTQTSWNIIGSHINPFNPQLQQWLSHHGSHLQDPQTLSSITHMIHQQASMLGFLNAYWATIFIYLAIAPLVLLLEKPKFSALPQETAHAH